MPIRDLTDDDPSLKSGNPDLDESEQNPFDTLIKLYGREYVLSNLTFCRKVLSLVFQEKNLSLILGLGSGKQFKNFVRIREKYRELFGVKLLDMNGTKIVITPLGIFFAHIARATIYDATGAIINLQQSKQNTQNGDGGPKS